LSVRQTEELVRRAQPGQSDAPPTAGEELASSEAATSGAGAMEEELQRVLGTRVQIVRSRRGGRLVLHYYDDDQLTGLIEMLLERGRL
jgi:ParB family chromosome partitioning protein